MMEQDYDKDKVQEFFWYLTKAYKKYQEKEKARGRLTQHIEKIKELSSKKISKQRAKEEFKKLEKLLVEVIMLEKSIISKGENLTYTDSIKYRIKELDKKLDRYLEVIASRRVRMKKLDEKIKKSDSSRMVIIDKKPRKSGLRSRLLDLEEKYYELKLDKAPKDKLIIIENKIKKLKEKI